MKLPIGKLQHLTIRYGVNRVRDVYFRYYRLLAPRVSLKYDLSNDKSNVMLLSALTLKAKIP